MADAGTAEAAPEPDPKTAEVRALIAGKLDVDIAPQSLFEISLSDEEALQIDSVRIKTLLRAIDQADEAPILESASHSAKHPRAPKTPSPITSTSASAAASPSVDIQALDPARWQARVDLDRARLAFYELSLATRNDLLQDHQKRLEALKPKESEEAKKAREAEAERQRALELAKEARSEAERVVSEELARLIGLDQTVDALRKKLVDERAELAARKDGILVWQRRVRDAKASDSVNADATYDDLRLTLKDSRDKLSKALDDLGSSSSDIPSIGPDPLNDVSQDIPTDAARQRRAHVAASIQLAEAEEAALRKDSASTLLDEVTSLNRERLGLLPYLSSQKRNAITGFTQAGFDQARSEARHLYLILRYHRHVVGEWFQSIRSKDGVHGLSVWRIAAVLVPWILVTAVFVWLRRRSPVLLMQLQTRVVEQDRAERRTTPSPLLRVVKFSRGVHRPLESLLFFSIMVWLLPSSAEGLLEVELLTVVVGWTVGGGLIVDTINALAAAGDTPGASSSAEVSKLRLRSLRLVGRVVVLFALILVVSSRLVGQGTVYSWVLSTCWFAALPVFLLLVRWWRHTVFERVDRVRRKTAAQAWVLANREGWKSFLAAMIGAVHLFFWGAYKVTRNWLAGFDLARRALAYLFKRELDKLAESKSSSTQVSLTPEVLSSLAPDRPLETWIACPADRVIEALQKRISSGAGGVVAVIGAPGMGKTSVLSRLENEAQSSLTLPCNVDTSLSSLRGRLSGEPRLILLDDAHAVIKPVIRGLVAFDELLAEARARSTNSLWCRRASQSAEI